uniref:Transposase n=1 Tax=Haemonchus placei TaxID=6290 RepID=A0A0N4VWR3_HAEPC
MKGIELQLVTACSSRDSTLAYLLGSLWRTLLGIFETLFPGTIVKMFDEPDVLIIDVVVTGQTKTSK